MEGNVFLLKGSYMVIYTDIEKCKNATWKPIFKQKVIHVTENGPGTLIGHCLRDSRESVGILYSDIYKAIPCTMDTLETHPLALEKDKMYCITKKHDDHIEQVGVFKIRDKVGNDTYWENIFNVLAFQYNPFHKRTKVLRKYHFYEVKWKGV